ncbi:tautomerase family protein [uncultured Roseobacter sp.]|uniref:tautomerase family protein n=2 Tax=uncultured Roseobacter sp. TaxID=114847 RepID=UPI00262308D2|nr:tautomerase family protein [uncultured Roseobacter sp.]
MPFNKLHVPQNLSVEKCRQINDLLHDSLVENCAVNPEDYFCIVSRYAAEDMILHPTFMGERDVAATIIIDITLLAGRSDDQKEALYFDVRERLKNIGFPPENSIIYLTENGPIDWSFSQQGSVKKVLGLAPADLEKGPNLHLQRKSGSTAATRQST